jgi:hypothetical protein
LAEIFSILALRRACQARRANGTDLRARDGPVRRIARMTMIDATMIDATVIGVTMTATMIAGLAIGTEIRRLAIAAIGRGTSG